MEPYEAMVERIARVCHAANREYQAATGEPTSPNWDMCGDDMRASARAGVEAALDGATPEQLHQSWMDERTAAGWTLGDVKDGVRKTHPCLVPYAELPESQRLKDYLFGAIVGALSSPTYADLRAAVDRLDRWCVEEWERGADPQAVSDLRAAVAVMRLGMPA